jgi:RNA polymerase sigma-70 factor, ECF subfamily
MENSEDSAIIKDCQAGRPEEFGRLYDKYIRKIYDFIYFKTAHKETAEDLTSRTFLKALENINGFDGGRGTFSAWLYRIARNTVIDHYRTRKFDANIEDIWDLAGKEDMARDIDTREKLARVEKYLSALKREHREIVMMRLWGGMSHKEIAEALGKSEAGCKMLYSRAITALRRDMPLAVFFYLVWLRF